MILRKFIPTLLLCFSVNAVADVTIRHHYSVDEKLANALEWSAPEDLPQSGNPNFTILGQEKNFIIGFGGNLKATASFDFGNPLDNENAFITSEIPSNAIPGNGAKWQFGAASSELWINAVAFPNDKNRVGAYINVNFQGENYAPKLQYAYLKWRNLTAGYDYNLFSDMGAAAPTIDFEGPNSFTGLQAPLVNFEKAFGKHGCWQFGIGANLPFASIYNDDFSESVSQRLPDIPAYIQYNLRNGGHLRFSAVMRNIYYRNLTTQRNNDLVGWGVKLSGTTNIGPLNLFFQALYGHGISSYYQDLTECEMDLSISRLNPGRRATLPSWGAYGALDYAITDAFHFSASYSHMRLYPGKDYIAPDVAASYRYAQYLSTTLTYSINSALSTGIEYIYGRRQNFDGTSRHNNRIQTCLCFSF